VIVAIDGQKIASTNDYFDALDKHQSGNKIKITVLRNGEKRDFEATLEGAP
jgi:S1-C subfamily serine protease